MAYQKLSQWAKDNSYTYQGAYNLYKAGALDCKVLSTGSILVKVEDASTILSDVKTCVLYSRVSSSKQKDDLIRQHDRLKSFASANGFVINKEYSEIASGMNDKRPKLLNLMNNSSKTTLIIEHKDRLTRFGYNYLVEYFKKCDIDIIVINESSNSEDGLMEDLVSIITSFCARLYGNRKSTRKTKMIIDTLNND